MEPISDALEDQGVGTIGEIFDGDPPHHPRGAPAQAWSVACTLDAWRLLRPAEHAGREPDHRCPQAIDAERQRIEDSRNGVKHWRRWGPYLSERQWGTVREDYSPYGTAWDYLSHDQARSRAYRWGEDGIAGFCDDRQLLVPGARPVERERSDPQGTAVRADQQRGQPRRGRQGALLLSRCGAEPRLSRACSTSSRRRAYPYEGLIDGERTTHGPDRDGVRADRHRSVRRGPLLRRRGRVRQGRRRTTS